jgi:pyruvate/2-oxoglutarate dehydrogenase complex dihydrolipoamide acyltransferase (E2) component
VLNLLASAAALRLLLQGHHSSISQSMVYGGYDLLGASSVLGGARRPFPLRTHREVESAAARLHPLVERYHDPDPEVRRRLSASERKLCAEGVCGVVGASALLDLPYLDLVRDTMLDMMHIAFNVVGKHLVPYLMGKRDGTSIEREEQQQAAAAAAAASSEPQPPGPGPADTSSSQTTHVAAGPSTQSAARRSRKNAKTAPATTRQTRARDSTQPLSQAVAAAASARTEVASAKPSAAGNKASRGYKRARLSNAPVPATTHTHAQVEPKHLRLSKLR